MVAPEKIFVGQEGTAKVWVNASRAECDPEQACSEREMVLSLIRIYEYLQINGFCQRLSRESVQAWRGLQTVAEVSFKLEQPHRE